MNKKSGGHVRVSKPFFDIQLKGPAVRLLSLKKVDLFFSVNKKLSSLNSLT